MEAKIDEAKSSGTLDLSGQKLRDIPKEVFEIGDALTELNLSENSLSSLGGAFAKLISLKTLNLKKNVLTSLPISLSNLTDLETVDVSRNQLKTFPQCLAESSSVKTVVISGNPLSKFVAFSDASTITEIDASSCSMTRISGPIGTSKTLRSLNLRANKLTSLPADIGDLESLQSLDVSHNMIKSLPPKMGLLKKLQDLDVSNNPDLGNPPTDVLNKGIEAIIAHLAAALDIGVGSTSAAIGDGLTKAEGGKKAEFQVKVRNKDGKDRGVGGDSVKIFLKDLTKNRTVSARPSITDSQNGIYDVAFVPPARGGKFELHVQVNSEDINGSPFKIDVEENEEGENMESAPLPQTKEAFFKLFDRSGDGQLDREELLFLLCLLRGDTKEEELDAIMAKVDSSGDGMLSFTEFEKLLELPEMDGCLEKGANGTSWPPYDMGVTPKGYRVDLDVPGVSEESLQMRMIGEVLLVIGTKAQVRMTVEPEDPVRFQGRFIRMIGYPAKVDPRTLKAGINRGVMTILIQKMKASVERPLRVQFTRKEAPQAEAQQM